MSSQWTLLHDVIPTDSAIQVTAWYYGERVAAELPEGALVLDLGCGAGDSRTRFRQSDKNLEWVGVDVPSSPEASRREGAAQSIIWYDGVSLPFADSSIDCVFSRQVMEHVRHPERTLEEVARVLKPGASFIGSTSNLEPFHSLSLWNFTPYGFRTILEDAGLVLRELRPGIDGPTLIKRQMTGLPPEMSKYFSNVSPRNEQIIEEGRAAGLSHARINDRMLQYCGHFAFHAYRPSP